ncbi:methyltransferase [Nocardiopsis sp. CA-288880]|uniref:methyltransferase n=1 Tax=Nocardiopsis sp. CA-288880 TaxID=3239995 RepID=UPI003D961DA9
MSLPPASSPISDSAARIFELVTSSWVSTAVSAAAELGVADVMSETPMPVGEIAERVGTDADALYRLLRACAELEIVEESPGRAFSLTGDGLALREDAPDSMRGYARWLGGPDEGSTMVALADAVRTGEPVWEAVHGAPVWQYMSENPRSEWIFDRGMDDLSAQLTRTMVQDYDFGDCGLVVDVGGGRGVLLALVLATHPHLEGVLFERPEVVARSDSVLDRPGIAERCRIEAGDFFESVPAGGDTYLLAQVIHNWGDEDAVRILANCRRAMRPDGRVLLAEMVVYEGVERSHTAKFMDLSMLAHCGGKQRTPTQFAELFEASGLRLNRVVSGVGVGVVEGVLA